MPDVFTVRASDRSGKAVPSRFEARADGSLLDAKDDTAPYYSIPDGARKVEVKVTPQGGLFWEYTFEFSIDATDGSMSIPDLEAQGRVELKRAGGNDRRMRLTFANVKVSQFRDRTDHVVGLLQKPPTSREVYDAVESQKRNRVVRKIVPAKEMEAHTARYGAWPPGDWKLHEVPDADFLQDPKKPVQSGALRFTKNPDVSRDMDTTVDSVVLERAGTRPVPQLFAVTWPNVVGRQANAGPTPFLLYIRQYNYANNYDQFGLFVYGGLAPYPDNFDYADSGLFESLHYAKSPLKNRNSKGVPYQVARANAKVVAVFPCTPLIRPTPGTAPDKVPDEDKEWGVLYDPHETERILQEVQAFMFWKAGIATPPASVGKTAIAAFSSGCFFLDTWLKDDAKRKSHFISKVVSAVYFLDPMPRDKKAVYLDGFIDSALKWESEGADKRIRIYMRQEWPSLEKVVKPLPSPPHVTNSPDDRRTVAVITNPTWAKAFGLPASRQAFWGDVHHAIAGTMLTHALAWDFKS